MTNMIKHSRVEFTGNLRVEYPDPEPKQLELSIEWDEHVAIAEPVYQ